MVKLQSSKQEITEVIAKIIENSRWFDPSKIERTEMSWLNKLISKIYPHNVQIISIFVCYHLKQRNNLWQSEKEKAEFKNRIREYQKFIPMSYVEAVLKGLIEA